MGGCPYALTRPSVITSPVADQPMTTQRSPKQNTTKAFWLVAIGIGMAVGGQNLHAKEWTGSIGEPLRDSTEDALALVVQLRQAGARFYGSWRCPACFQQMSLFGKQAGAQVNYVECNKPKELPKQRELCENAGITAVPTWTLPDGRRKVGLQQLTELSAWIRQN